MKKEKNKIYFQMIPTPSRPLNLSSLNNDKSNINSINNIKNKEMINTDSTERNRNKTNPIKINKNNFISKRLNTINIVDKKIDILYDWNILLNNKNSGIYYKKSEYEKLSINDFETDKSIPKNCLILLDLPDSQIKKYFGKKSFLKFNNIHPKTARERTFSSTKKKQKDISHKNLNDILDEYDSNKEHNNLHPISIYSHRDPHQPFYFSNDFNNYYKFDFKHFSQMLPNLKAKVKTSNKKLVNEILKLKYKSKKDSINLKHFFENDEKIFKVQDLIIAGIRNNPTRLMKNLYMLKHPNYQKVKQDKRMYFKTMKPIGEYFGEIDYTKNERWRTYNELKKLRKNDKKIFTIENNKNSDYKTNLTLSYYKSTDPSIKYFNQLIKKYNRINKEKSDDSELIYTEGISYNKKSKQTETENSKKNDFFRDKLMKNEYKEEQNEEQIGNNLHRNYKNYFITETTKNSNNE